MRWTALALASFTLAGCTDSLSNAPTPPPPAPTGTALAVFTDVTTGFQTSEVLDVDSEVVRFDTSNDSLLWAPDNLVFDRWAVDGTSLGAGGLYRVRFGTVGEQRRAYFTETGRGTICDLSVRNNELIIEPTDLLPP